MERQELEIQFRQSQAAWEEGQIKTFTYCSKWRPRLESLIVCELLRVSLPTKEDSLREGCHFTPSSAPRIRHNKVWAYARDNKGLTRHWNYFKCILTIHRQRYANTVTMPTFARVVLCRDDVLIPDYLLCWIQGHLVELLNLRDSALVTWYLCV